MEKEEMMVLELCTIVTSGKESITAEVGQEHLKPQGFPQGWEVRQQCNLSTDSHGQAQLANPIRITLSLIQGGIHNTLHCTYTNTILTKQLNTATSKKKNKLLSNSKLMNYLGKGPVRELVIIKGPVNLNRGVGLIVT